MDSPEKKVSDYIDFLNREKDPEKYCGTSNNPEVAKLLGITRLVRTLREPAMPGPGYSKKLAGIVAGKIQKEVNKPGKNKITAWGKRGKLVAPAVAVLIAGIFIFSVFSNWTGFFKPDVVYAMEKAVSQLTGYYGVLEVNSKNAAGEEWLVKRIEIWSQGDKYSVRQNDDIITVNNGEKKWQVRHKDKEVVLLPLLPDSKAFDLQDEAAKAKKYPHSVVGTEIIASRPATKLKISPQGGLSYYLWIDQETNLPVQLQTAMQNAIQTTYTFTTFEPNKEINPGIFDFRLPEGYKIIEDDPGQLVATLEEAAAICKLVPLVPRQAPDRIIAYSNRIVLDYGDTIIIETAAEGQFKPAANSAMGTAAGGPLEVLSQSLRWRQQGIEITVEGMRREALALEIAGNLALPESDKSLAERARFKVPYDLEVVKAEQQQVDGGHGPWQLDPLQVALTFANLKVTPGGIVGEPEIPYSSFKLIVNNGVEAIVEVTEGPVKRVYLKRLVRQDETGIWSVVGYDPR